MRKVTVGTVVAMALLCWGTQAELAWGQENADHDGDEEGKPVLDQMVDGAMHEISHEMRRLISEAVQTSISEAMMQSEAGDSDVASNISVVDEDGNVLEVLSFEDGTITVDFLLEETLDEEDEEDGPRFKKFKGKNKPGSTTW